MGTTGRSSPALLSLPPELRNVIFSHVYGIAVADHIVLLRFKSSQADVESNKAPPGKDSLLIRRQVYNEMKGLQAAAHRRYWIVQKFLIIADRDAEMDLHLATNGDLQHVCHLDVHRYFWQQKYTALISFYYSSVSAWLASMEGSRMHQTRPSGSLPWYMTKCSRSMQFLNGLKDMMNTLREDHGASEYVDESTVDPRAARGLDADEMHRLPSMIRNY